MVTVRKEIRGQLALLCKVQFQRGAGGGEGGGAGNVVADTLLAD